MEMILDKKQIQGLLFKFKMSHKVAEKELQGQRLN